MHWLTYLFILLVVFFVSKVNKNFFSEIKKKTFPLILVGQSSDLKTIEFGEIESKLNMPFTILDFNKKIITVVAKNEFKKNSLINLKEYVIDKNLNESISNLNDIEKKIVKILNEKIRPAVAKDGGDIKFKEFKNGVVKVQLQGSCSGCPSSTMTLKQGVQNLLCHYLPEVKEVIAIQ